MTRGTRPGHLPPPSTVEIEGRRCSEPGCETRLSVYNQRDRCWQHADVAFPLRRGKRLPSDRG